MKDERWFLVILICLFIMLTILYCGTFFYTTQVQAQQIRNLNTQIQQQQAVVNSFVSQLQTCKNMSDFDRVLKSINVERIKQEA